MSDDRKNRWLFDISSRPTTDQISSRSKLYLYDLLHRSITHHDIKECFRLLKVLPKETSLDPYILFRFIMILFESNRVEDVDTTVLIHTEREINKLDTVKPDIFVEFLGYLIRHDRLRDAKELFAERHRFMTRDIHRHLPFVDVNLSCYEFLLNYLEWKGKLDDGNAKVLDVSIQGWLVNAISKLKTTASNHEYFIMCILNILLYYGYQNKAYLVINAYRRSNTNNLSAQLIYLHVTMQLGFISIPKNNEIGDAVEDGGVEDSLAQEAKEQNLKNQLESINNFTKQMEEEQFKPEKYPVEKEEKIVLERIQHLDPSRHELMEFRYSCDLEIVDEFKIVMDGLEVVSEVCNMSRWNRISEILESLQKVEHRSHLPAAKALWHKRYRRFWQSIDFVGLSGNKLSSNDKKRITDTLIQLRTIFGRG